MVSRIFRVDGRAPVTDDEHWYQPQRAITKQLAVLMGKSGVLDGVREGDFVALKVHFGVRGTTRTLRSIFMRTVASEVKAAGGVPFFTETCGLGMGKHFNHAQGRLQVAAENGYTSETLGAPIVIADGLIGAEGVRVEVDGSQLKEVWVAKAITQADHVVMLTHFTGHGSGCFGGAIKNLGVGCVTKRTKYDLHVEEPPSINEKCNDCGWCVEICPADAISLPERTIDLDKCWKCGGCLHCPQEAISPPWTDGDDLGRRIADSALGVVKAVGKDKLSYVNFLMDVTPHCDCVPYSDTSVVADQGIIAGQDPVALDTASLDFVNQAEGVPDSMVPSTALGAGGRKLDSIHSHTSCKYQLEGARDLGIGVCEYKIEKVF